jgi:hypothetical protein
VKADPVLITTLNLGSFPPYGDGTVQSGITAAITAWNVANNPDLPLTGIGATPNVKKTNSDFGENVVSISLTGLGAYNYIFMHWGGPNTDSTYKNPQLYYLNGVNTWTFTAPLNGTQVYGLSFYSLYSPTTSVPDGGATAALLGVGLLALAGLARRQRKA